MDLTVKLTAERHSVRLVAIRASQQETAKRCRKHRANAKENKKLIDIANLRPDPRHLQSQKRTRNTLNCRLIELLG